MAVWFQAGGAGSREDVKQLLTYVFNNPICACKIRLLTG
jgi:hypothetical protein